MIDTSRIDSVIELGNGRRLGIMGSHGFEIDLDNRIAFYESGVFICGEDSILLYGGFMDERLLIENKEDTTLFLAYKYLPVGDSLQSKLVLWQVAKLHFVNSMPVLKTALNRTLRKYSKEEVEIVLLKTNELINNKPKEISEANVQTINQLCYAAMCGSLDAKNIFSKIDSTLGYIGESNGESIDFLRERLKVWEK